MAFLDRLVSDVIKKSTGINARSFVRSVGGKNILLLGGAAVAAAVAANKFQSGSQGAPPPIPPPIPRNVPPIPTNVPPPPPPPPPPQELLYAIVRTMVAASFADGEQNADEKALIEKRLGESGLSLDQIQQINDDLTSPPAPAEISTLVDNAHDRELLYRFGALVVLADNAVADSERAWLVELAEAMGIDATRRGAIDREIFDVT